MVQLALKLVRELVPSFRRTHGGLFKHKYEKSASSEVARITTPLFGLIKGPKHKHTHTTVRSKIQAGESRFECKTSYLRD